MMMDRVLAQLPVIGGFIGIIIACFFMSGWDSGWQYGLVPQSRDHLIGIVGINFLHADIWHLASNMTSLAVLLTILVATHKHTWLVVAVLTVVTGTLLWLFGPAFDEPHIGASGLVYALMAFLIARSVNVMTIGTIAAALAVAVLYGESLVNGIRPEIEALGISWQGHLAGVVAGVAYATVDRG